MWRSRRKDSGKRILRVAARVPFKNVAVRAMKPRDDHDLTLVDVIRNSDGNGSEVEEEYSCDASGLVKVTLWNRSANYYREYTLGRWSNASLQAAEVVSSQLGRKRRHK